ncbi:hypothetical protein ACIRU8_39335 [Streptomyces sp. NPDC101175]|uniref:hypothetical protein n=1 Tax=Streptomyces sp. NPDC101175 TaxID=3366123 RepID=UPI003837A8B5
MSPFLFDADLGATELGRKARAAALLLPPLSISDLFAEYAAANRARRVEIRLGADPELLAELDGFDSPAAA